MAIARSFVPGVLLAVATLGVGACSSKPTMLVTNLTGVPLTVVVYDYSAPTSPPGFLPGVRAHGPIGQSPEYSLGRVDSGTACLTFGAENPSDEFALVGEDATTGMDTPPSPTFIPGTANEWTVTVASPSATPPVPVPTSNSCSIN